jgi:DNA-binding NarL/FixJ family response regulator
MPASKKETQTISVLIVDDHPAMREGLAACINRQPDMSVCGDAGDARTAMRLLKKQEPGVVILDLSLRESDGLDLLRSMLFIKPKLNVLVCSMHPETPYGVRTIQNGARGYINKQSETSEIVDAIRTVAAGETYMSELVRESLQPKASGTNRGTKTRDGVEQLSDRELQVFQHIGQGLNLDEIAKRIRLSRHTIETYRQRIKKKLNIKSNNELICIASKWTLDMQ